MTNWPTHRGRTRARRQLQRWERRQRALARRARRRAKLSTVEVSAP